MSYTSFTITQPFLGAPLQFTPALGSVEFELLVDCYVSGSAPKQDKLSQVTIDFYNTATVDLTNGALVKTFNVFPAWMTSPTQSNSSGFTPSPASSANLQSHLGDSAYGSSRSGTASGRVSKKAKKDVSTKKTAEARLPGFSIMTKDGIDVTSSAGRGTKTKEQREHAHLMRQLKACADCKRKKVRCDPSHRRSHNEMSRTSTSNASSASDRISPAASTPSLQDAGSFGSANTFDDLSFFSDDFTLFPDDAAFFQGGMDMAMWDTVAPSVKEYMSSNLSNFNFETTDHQSSNSRLASVNRASQDTSHDVLSDQVYSPMWDAENYQFQDLPGDWFSSSSPRLDVPDNIPQNTNQNAVLSQLEQSYFIPQNVHDDGQGLSHHMPRLDSPNALQQAVHYAQVESPRSAVNEQVLDGDTVWHTVSTNPSADTSAPSSPVPTQMAHVRNVPRALRVQNQSSVRLDNTQTVRLDNNRNVDAVSVSHREIHGQTPNMLVSHIQPHTERQEGGSVPVVQLGGDGDGGSQGQLQATPTPQVGSQQGVALGRCLDPRLVLPASMVARDTNGNGATVVAPNISLVVQDPVSSLLAIVAVAVMAVCLLSLGSGLLAWARDAGLQSVGFDDSWLVQVAVLGAFVFCFLPDVFGAMSGLGVFGSGVGLGSLFYVASAFFSASSHGCASMITSSNSRLLPLKSLDLRAGHDSAPSKLKLGLLRQLTMVTVGLV